MQDAVENNESEFYLDQNMTQADLQIYCQELRIQNQQQAQKIQELQSQLQNNFKPSESRVDYQSKYQQLLISYEKLQKQENDKSQKLQQQIGESYRLQQQVETLSGLSDKMESIRIVLNKHLSTPSLNQLTKHLLLDKNVSAQQIDDQFWHMDHLNNQSLRKQTLAPLSNQSSNNHNPFVNNYGNGTPYQANNQYR